MNKAIITIIFSCVLAPAMSQTGLKGTVIDQSQKTPLEYANIALYGLPDSTLIKGAVTDENGNYELMELDRGTYYLTVSFLGYLTIHTPSISVQKSQVKQLDPIALDRKSVV